MCGSRPEPDAVTASTAVDVALTYRHHADQHWPFAFEARQYFTLGPTALHVEMQFTNLADLAQPVGLGWHPYFPKRSRSRLHVELPGDALAHGRFAAPRHAHHHNVSSRHAASPPSTIAITSSANAE